METLKTTSLPTSKSTNRANLSRYRMLLALVAVVALLTQSKYSNLELAPKISTKSVVDLNDHQISYIAVATSVRILSPDGYGSGVIVKRYFDGYLILTNRHVVSSNKSDKFKILTVDGKLHYAILCPSFIFGDLDLALLEFKSPDLYKVIEIGRSERIELGEIVNAVGFPNWEWVGAKVVKNTKDYGMRAFQLTRGKVVMLPLKPLATGYQIGYTNNVQHGMSGGAILNRSGQLVGVNGRSPYPLAGIDAFEFADGTKPSEALYKRMEALSWGIPSQFFKLRLCLHPFIHL